MLLEDVRKLLTKKLVLNIPLLWLEGTMVSFLDQNLKQNPGSTEMVIQVTDDSDPEDVMTVRLKTGQQGRIMINDELIAFLQEQEHLEYRVEKS
jgi:hypothetical protein